MNLHYYEIEKETLFLIEKEVWDILTYCLSMKRLPAVSGDSFWLSLSFPNESQQYIADMVNQRRGLYKDGNPQKVLDSNNIKKHIHDVFIRIRDCLDSEVNKVKWKELIRKTV